MGQKIVIIGAGSMAFTTTIVSTRMTSIAGETETGLGFCILSIEVLKNVPPVIRTMNATNSAEIYSIRPNPSGWVCVGFLFARLNPIIVTTDESISEALLAASDIIATEPEKNPIATLTTAIAAFEIIPRRAVFLSTLFRVSSSIIER